MTLSQIVGTATRAPLSPAGRCGVRGVEGVRYSRTVPNVERLRNWCMFMHSLRACGIVAVCVFPHTITEGIPMRIDYATERLLPREIAPMLERSRYAIGPERFTCWKLAAFGRRLIVELVRRDR